MSHDQAAVYRRRATHLRTLAHEMTHTPAMTLHTHATVDTWQGPCADACTNDLVAAQRAVHVAVDDLGDQAWRFDRHADDLEAAAFRADRAVEAERERRAEQDRENQLP